MAVLDAVAAEFKVHGFDNTSTEQLCEAAGVKRSSLYNAFVSKDELFVRALERYLTVLNMQQVAMLEDPQLTGADQIRLLVKSVIDEERAAREHGQAAGCLLVNGLMNPDLRQRDQRISQILDHEFDRVVGLIEKAIRAGHADGSVSLDLMPHEGALLVATLINGVRVTSQTRVSSDALQRVALNGLHAFLR
ncbi:TetR/AcrR family transcriptional regulator [Streptomyces sp. SudanB66_2053]|uniref:TetR/AcrR family transcriptional regulator n=1 Tax=Streptomyces sp. SudanB66_2053 TaxID=3035277 RepID=UPI003F56F38F